MLVMPVIKQDNQDRLKKQKKLSEKTIFVATMCHIFNPEIVLISILLVIKYRISLKNNFSNSFFQMYNRLTPHSQQNLVSGMGKALPHSWQNLATFEAIFPP